MWHYQLLGRYTFPWQIGFAANWRYPERLPVLADRRRRRHLPGAQPLELRGALLPSNNLSDDRSDNVSLLNFRLDKAFDVGRFKVSGMLDIYNVLNSEAVTNFALTLGPSYKRVTAVLDPRVFMVGARLEF